jgi:hypothetical protein
MQYDILYIYIYIYILNIFTVSLFQNMACTNVLFILLTRFHIQQKHGQKCTSYHKSRLVYLLDYTNKQLENHTLNDDDDDDGWFRSCLCT